MTRRPGRSLSFFVICLTFSVHSFQSLRSARPAAWRYDGLSLRKMPVSHTQLHESSASSISESLQPQVVAEGTSTKHDLFEAIEEAVTLAAAKFPKSNSLYPVDLGIVYVSSLYDSSQTGIITVPAILAAGQANGLEIKKLVGASCAAVVDTVRDLEAVPAVSITLLALPDTKVQPFYIHPNDLPEDTVRTPVAEWKRIVGLSRVDEGDAPVFWLLPSPAFSTQLDDLLQALYNYFPGSTTTGAIASTVSSLSRAQLYSYGSSDSTTCHSGGGCVGVAITGDIRLDSLTARGAKAVGGIYNVLQGQDSTIQTIVLDEAATGALKQDEEEEEEEEDEEEEDPAEPIDSKQAMAQFYAKAKIPKPVLAEANFLMRTLSDDDQAFMRRQLLVGLEQGGSVGRSASELMRLAKGEGHRFTIFQVASAGMKDGSVHLPLGQVKVSPGTRMRFFVREPDFATREIDALWTGYKQRQLNAQFSDEQSTFTPSCCFLIPTLDRGNKFFVKPNFETATAARYLSTDTRISGFYANGIINRMDGSVNGGARVGVQGSASGYFLLGSKSGRPVYSAAAAAKRDVSDQEDDDADEYPLGGNQQRPTKGAAVPNQRAPRSDNGELILKRREVHSGRALTVSTVEWSVAEKTANPSSALEGYMWDKETEVDRFRERVPLANLVSQCRLSTTDPTVPKPRDWVGPIRQSGADFIVIPECKRSDPASGSLRKRYDIKKLAREFTLAGAPALSVNCDPVLFGGSMEHVTEARSVSSQAAVEKPSSDDGVVAPPILASDLILYPYQLYKLRLAGADAINLLVGALETKDLQYLSKIAASLQLQVLATVTTVKQLERVAIVENLNGIVVSNRELENFTFDETGEQALHLLKSDELASLQDKYNGDLFVFAEGRVGIIQSAAEDGTTSTMNYLLALRKAGAMGAIVGGGLSPGIPNGLSIEEMKGASI